MSDITARFVEIVGKNNLLTGDAISEDYSHDEELTNRRSSPRTSPNRRARKRLRSCWWPPRNTACR